MLTIYNRIIGFWVQNQNWVILCGHCGILYNIICDSTFFSNVSTVQHSISITLKVFMCEDNINCYYILVYG